MTDMSTGMRALPLEGSPHRVLLWLSVLAFGIPVVVVAAAFGYAYAQGAPRMPLLISAVGVLAITLVVTLWILHMIRTIAVTLDAHALTVVSGVATQRFPLAALRASGVRTVNLAEHVELKPFLRTWGIGMPGLASGWFRLRNGGKAFCIVTERRRVTVLRADDGTWILLSLADASALRGALAAA